MKPNTPHRRQKTLQTHPNRSAVAEKEYKCHAPRQANPCSRNAPASAPKASDRHSNATNIQSNHGHIDLPTTAIPTVSKVNTDHSTTTTIGHATTNSNADQAIAATISSKTTGKTSQDVSKHTVRATTRKARTIDPIAPIALNNSKPSSPEATISATTSAKIHDNALPTTIQMLSTA